jgi:alpha-tubulin suppressor-like RCC1 family protein
VSGVNRREPPVKKLISMKKLVAVALSLVALTRAWGYAFITDIDGHPIKWIATTIPIQIKADNSAQLSDGHTRATAIQAAMNDVSRGWNQYLGTIQFIPQITAAGTGTDDDGVNQIFFSSTAYNYGWDANTLAITTAWAIGDRRTEADMIFNTAFTWDSYRNALKSAGPIDIERVALHELGHVLGLDHPDDYGQTKVAIMNSVISDLDSLQTDDIAGGQALYGAPGAHPANDNFANAPVITADLNVATANGTNVEATKEAGEPNHAGNSGGHSVWWKWTSPGPGSVTVDTWNSSFDTLLAVYTGSSVSSLTAVTSNDDAQAGSIASSVTFTASGGIAYWIAVDGKNGDTGSIILNVTPSVLVAPAIVTQPSSQAISEGGLATFQVTATGNPAPTYQWQFNGNNIPGATGSSFTITVARSADSGSYSVVVSNSRGSVTSAAANLLVGSLPGIVQIAASESSTSFVRADGSRWVVGYATGGEMGIGHFAGYNTATSVESGIAAIYACADNYAHSVMLRQDGTLVSCGDNWGGELGDGTNIYRDTWVPVISGTQVVAAGVAGDDSFFLTSDGTLYGTGDNRVGQLGDGTVNSRSTAEVVARDVATFSSGGGCTLFVKSDGTVWGMGSDTNGAMRTGAFDSRFIAYEPNPLPVKIADNTRAVCASGPVGMFLKNDDTLWIVGTYASVTYPALTKLDSNVATIVGGSSNYAYIKKDGTLWIAGYNYYGQLGEPTSVFLDTTPQQIASGVVSAAIGDGFVVFLKTDGTLWGVGNNSRYQLGTSAPVQTSSPVLIAAGTNAAPASPVSVATSTSEPGMVMLIWAPLGQATAYEVWRSPTASSNDAVAIGTVNSGQFYFVDGSTVSGGAYYYWVRSVNSVGESGFGVAAEGTAVAAIAPIFTTSPADFHVASGSNGLASFSMVALGVPAPTYHWEGRYPRTSEWTPLDPNNTTFSGVYSSTLTLNTGLDSSWQGMEVRCVASNIAGIATSSAAAVIFDNVPLLPSVSIQPGTVNVHPGETAEFDVIVSGGTGPFGYDWQYYVPSSPTSGWRDVYSIGFSDTRYSGFLTASLQLAKVKTSENGIRFRCVVTDAANHGISTDEAVLSVTVPMVPTADFNGDGNADLLWENTAGIDRAIWYMDETAISGFDYLAGIDAEWKIVGTADFDGDGQTDIAWEDTDTGDRTCWFMNGKTIASFGYFALVDTAWHIAAIGDFDGDGKPDLIWENNSTGDRAVWFLDGVNIKSFGYIAGIDPTWHIVGAADFDGDGQTDLVWENPTTGDRTIWYMNGATLSSFGYIANVPGAWQIAMVADMDGDGHPDLVWENRTTGDRAIWLMNDVTQLSAPYLAYVDPVWHIAP